MEDNEEKDTRSLLRAFGVLKIGFVAILSILAGFSIGYYIDTKLQMKTPIFMIIFTLAGVAGGYYMAYREIMKIIQ